MKTQTRPKYEHVVSEDVIVASPAPNLEEVLDEVMMLVRLP